MKREQFIELAGGVYKNHEYYRNWSGKDKAENFWDFFDNDSDDFIHSVYAGITVDLLSRKKQYSIEHIIPKSFLKNYLHRENRDRREIMGATTNPFNFAAAHRDINSNRGNFPFDFEDDKLVRSHRVQLEGIYSDYGFDHEDEWIIPARTQGDIARSILYMCLIYNIKELYNEHLNTYTHWAIVDPPNIWEIKYNDWIYQRKKIRNPFIPDFDKPVESMKLLKDRELLDSILLAD